MRQYLLPENGTFYKANLHSHTNLSDGKLSPEEMKALYQKNGYSVLAFTDHDIFIPHHDLTDENFLVLSGFETSIHQTDAPSGVREKRSHLCFIAKTPDIDMQPCWNPEYTYTGNAGKHIDKIKYDKTQPFYKRTHSVACLNEMIKMGKEAGFFVTLNHPTWSLTSYTEYSQCEGMHAMEIFNTGCEICGYPSYVPQVYNDLLCDGKKLFAIAADDNHNTHPEASPYFGSFGGFVMIKADELKYEAITDALFAGNFYASCGPEIYDLYIEDDELHVSCSDAVAISLNTGLRSAQAHLAPKGETVNGATFKLNEEYMYIRITVKDATGKCADTNAYFWEEIQNKMGQ